MLGYGFLDCASICEIAPSATTSTELANPIILSVLRLIHSSFRADFRTTDSYDAAILLGRCIYHTNEYVCDGTSVNIEEEYCEDSLLGENCQLLPTATRPQPHNASNRPGVVVIRTTFARSMLTGVRVRNVLPAQQNKGLPAACHSPTAQCRA